MARFSNIINQARQQAAGVPRRSAPRRRAPLQRVAPIRAEPISGIAAGMASLAEQSGNIAEGIVGAVQANKFQKEIGELNTRQLGYKEHSAALADIISKNSGLAQNRFAKGRFSAIIQGQQNLLGIKKIAFEEAQDAVDRQNRLEDLRTSADIRVNTAARISAIAEGRQRRREQREAALRREFGGAPTSIRRDGQSSSGATSNTSKPLSNSDINTVSRAVKTLNNEEASPTARIAATKQLENLQNQGKDLSDFEESINKALSKGLGASAQKALTGVDLPALESMGSKFE